MGIFHRRYLCIFCFVFLLFSFGATFFSSSILLLISIVTGSAIVGFVICAIVLKKQRFQLVFSAICGVAATVALINSMLFVALPKERAEEYIGENIVEVKVIKLEYADESSSYYSTRILRVGDEKTNIKAYLNLDICSDAEYGDRIIAKVYITEKNLSNASDGILLNLHAVDGEGIYIKKSNAVQFSPDAFRVATARLNESFSHYVDSIFDEDSRGLVKGFLVNDKRDLSGAQESAFRRSGTSHLLAVSGLHIALLLGFLDLLLRKIYIKKYIRCVIVSLFGVFFLALTDFAPSAVRSLLMLFAVYISYIFAEDNDSQTALFASVSLILLCSPDSVYDIGMWMSFFATLGLVSVYPYFERKLPRPKAKNKFVQLLLRFLLAIVRGILITLVANFFLLPIFWYCFGSVSLAAVPANIFLSPLSSLYLPMAAVALIIGKIPLLGTAAVWCVKVLGELIVLLAKGFAELPLAVVSLRLPGVNILVMIFTVTFVLTLVLKFKRKWLTALPACGFVLSFCICVAVFWLTFTPQLKYAERSGNELLITDKAGQITVCDMTNASTNAAALLYEELPQYAIEIENYILCNVNGRSESFIKILEGNAFIRNLYIPKTTDPNELLLAARIKATAEDYGSRVIFYGDGETVQLFDTTAMKLMRENGKSSCTLYSDELFFTYTGTLSSHRAMQIGAASRYFLIGSKPDESEASVAVPIFDNGNTLIIGRKQRENLMLDSFNTEKNYIPIRKNKSVVVFLIE